jgi:hypothetical protein
LCIPGALWCASSLSHSGKKLCHQTEQPEVQLIFCWQVHLVERIPFFDALYFVTTTLTTVGYGDVVAVSVLGKAAVLAMILVGVVLIPVQTSQLYSQLTARRLTLGALWSGQGFDRGV